MINDTMEILLWLCIGMVLGILFSAYLRGFKIGKNSILREFWAKLREDSHYTREEKDFFLTLVDKAKLKDLKH